ncbi:MAG: class I SAM-dependent methyltransferase [Candidatus Delongbacteria bacterium]|nr:class I SAM-dependent methyltransferase [Candidatus Delongbacteria bacterium]MBN2834802.1 class I SAM-dependent methyltransferase [Candidatus Delongbacteria bacterium]
MNTKDNIEAWSKNANSFGDDFLKNYRKEGDFWHKELLNDKILENLGNVDKIKILDAGCGEGYFSRILAMRNAKVTGLEPSDFIDFAIAYEHNERLGIEYIKEDLCDFSYRENYYDAVVSIAVVSINVMMDIPDFKTVLNNCIKSLKCGGILSFSILHPCFTPVKFDIKKNSYSKVMNYHDNGFIAVYDYFKEVQAQQTHDFYNHRTLSTYLNFLINNGMIIKKIDEPKLDSKFDNTLYSKDCHIPTFIIFTAEKIG